MSGEAEERIARLEGAVTRSLELLAEGRAEEARAELLRASPPHTPPLESEVSHGELERAFQQAEPEVAGMLDATSVAQRAMRQADASLGEALSPSELGTPFATETMAELLERQGDVASASRIRASLAGGSAAPAAGPAPEGDGSRNPSVATLERWLDNVRAKRTGEPA